MKTGLVRIIAGKWRSRRLQVPDVKDLRPTPDRVRETLFNWLAPYIVDAHCLDLFSGTGVLGFESASRGAGSVTMVDQSEEVIKILKQQAEAFDADNLIIYKAKIPKQLLSPDQPFDIIFLDPPYKEELLSPVAFYLEEHQFLANPAYIYMEADRLIKDNELPPNWHITKSKSAGLVHYHLAVRKDA